MADPLKNLTSGYAGRFPEISVRTASIAGITTQIFGLDELPPNCAEVACLWLLHPRNGNKEKMHLFATWSLAHWNQQGTSGRTMKELIVVVFDQRNHGSREIEKKANLSWREGNETHAQDMFSVYQGTAVDTSTLLDYLAGYAFSNKPIKITQNIVLGISLGGHAAWHVLLHDPRFNAAVIVIGCPDYTRLMSDRARLSKLSSYTTSDPPGSSFLGSKDFPPDLLAAVKRYDPAGMLLDKGEEDAKAVLASSLRGKRILNLVGGADKLVPYSCSEPFLKWLKQAFEVQSGGGQEQLSFQENIYDGVGHEFTAAMSEDAIAFICDSIVASAPPRGQSRI